MKRLISFALFVAMIFPTFCFLQENTSDNQTFSMQAPYRNTDLKLLIGGNLQQAYKTDKKEYSRKYFEIGLHKTVTTSYGHHPAGVFTHGPSIEIAPGNDPIYGFKYSAWGEVWLMVLGISGVYYTDFNHSNFKIRPELGIGASPFKLTFGYNVPTINNKKFKALQRSGLQITLNILFTLKKIKRES